MAHQRLFGILAVIASAIGFGAMAIFARIAYAGGADVSAVLLLRFSIATVVMVAIVMIMGKAWPGTRNALVLALMGLIYVAQSFAFFSALKYASAGLVALLLYLYPFLVTIGNGFIFRRPLGLQRLAAVVTAFAGTALTLWGGLRGEALGVALGASSALLYSIYILIGSKVLEEEDPFACSAIVMLAASLGFAVIVSVSAPVFPNSNAEWAAVIAIALFCTVVAMAGFFIGMRTLGAPDASTLSTLEPVVTIVLAALYLNESLSPTQLAGGVVILMAVIWITRLKKS